MRILILPLILVVLFGSDAVSQTSRESPSPGGQGEQAQHVAATPSLEAETRELFSDVSLTPEEAASDMPDSPDEPLTPDELAVAAETTDAPPLPGNASTARPAATPAASQSKGASKPTPARGAGDRLVIEDIDVDAVLVRKQVARSGQMPEPDGNDEIVLYDFANFKGFGGVPGKSGNAVFGGHVDSGIKSCLGGTLPPPCPAVLSQLSSVERGSEIVVQMKGASYRYKVTSNESVPVGTNWSSIVSSTSQESITVITCDGDFNPKTRTYDRRQVLKAVRIK
jgi:LPXTG-site transpeptidase (sortase) family protein